MRNVTFRPVAFQQFIEWAQENPKVYERLVKLIEECTRTPFTGTGKPEPLKHELKGSWSRRITDEHRLVYQVTNEAIIVLQCKYHY